MPGAHFADSVGEIFSSRFCLGFKISFTVVALCTFDVNRV